MALVYTKNISKKCIINLWKIEEDIDFFLNHLHLKKEELEICSKATHPIKQLEWLASRTCVKYTVEQLEHNYQGIEKDEFNNPYLLKMKGFVSLSHTRNYAVAVVSLEKEVGIDMEKVSDKLNRVSHKFLSESERLHAGDDLLKMCVYWCAKESLYKWYGKKNLSFKDNLFIEPFEDNPTIVKGKISVDRILTTEHDLEVFYVEDFVVTVTV